MFQNGSAALSGHMLWFSRLSVLCVACYVAEDVFGDMGPFGICLLYVFYGPIMEHLIFAENADIYFFVWASVFSYKIKCSKMGPPPLVDTCCGLGV